MQIGQKQKMLEKIKESKALKAGTSGLHLTPCLLSFNISIYCLIVDTQRCWTVLALFQNGSNSCSPSPSPLPCSSPSEKLSLGRMSLPQAWKRDNQQQKAHTFYPKYFNNVTKNNFRVPKHAWVYPSIHIVRGRNITRTGCQSTAVHTHHSLIHSCLGTI